MPTPLSFEMIAALPVADIHVHVPGTVTADTAWKLGVRNGFLTVEDGEWAYGPNTLHVDDPHEHYADIFHDSTALQLDAQGHPKDLRYNIEPNSFKSFDRIMATVQGHRHPPGGIQTEADYRLVLREYLKSCLAQKVLYTELQQNIRIAYQLYPLEPEAAARQRFFLMLKDAQAEYAQAGVSLFFLHCFNKTGMATDGLTPRERAMEGARWLMEAQAVAPGVFVGIESAGHEKDPTGWPSELREGYQMARQAGFGAEAHGGEGIGVEHMHDVISTLPITRLAHGFQAIEDTATIALVKARGITLVMSPSVNIALGSPIHRKDGKPMPKGQGGEPEYIESLPTHPFFALLREHGVKLALATDNPGMGGVGYKTMLAQMAGLHGAHPFPPGIAPLSAEEIALCCLNAIEAAFGGDEARNMYVRALASWLDAYQVRLEHPLLGS